MTEYSERIRQKVTDAFQPTYLEIVDDSARHAGHSGAHADGGGQTHFNVVMESSVFAGKSPVERQRAVYAVLSEELKERVHALSLRLTAPGDT